MNPNFFANNREKLRKNITSGLIILSASGMVQRTRDDDAFPFEQDGNFWYLTGIDEPDAILVIDESGEYLILPKRSDRHKIFSEQIDKDTIKNRSSINQIYEYEEGWKKLSAAVKKSSVFNSIKPPEEYSEAYDIYTNPASRNMVKNIFNIKPGLELHDISKEIISLRMIKTQAEVESIRQAIKLTGEVLVNISKNLPEYRSEHDIAAELNDFYFRKNLKYAFSPIVAGGRNATILHYNSNKALIKPDDLMLIDTGVKFNNYCSDITRTIAASPNDRQMAVHMAVVESQAYAMSLLKPGVNIRDYETKVGKFIGEKLRELGLIKEINSENVRKYYPHGTSHSLGIDVHDPADYSQPLKSGMVITVEPGIYIPEENIGVRIEDNVLITEDGVESLSAELSANLEKLSIIA